jgi:hypothetical protein
MGEVRIIKLGPISNGTEAVSFEDAFGYGVGGYSYADGEGRARRKKRKLERIDNRKEVRGERVANRQAVRADRVAGRTELQQSRKSKRLSKREMGTESRLARRTARADVRAYKRDLRNPNEVPSTQSATEPTQDVGAATTQDPSTTSSGYAPSTSSGGYSTGGSTSNGYEPSTSSGYSESTDSGYDEGYEDEGIETGDVYDQELVDETASNAYEMGYEDAQNDSGIDVEIEGDENYGDFDGIMGAEDRYNEMQDKNDMPVNPKVQEIADKCIWNEVLITKLKNDRKNSPTNPQEISKSILSRAKRLKDLKSELENYANFMGCYSNAEGSEEIIAERKKIVQIALNKARSKASGQAPVNVTPVNRSLKPRFSKDRIEVKSNATGTGLNGLDMIDDYDAPAERDFYLGADGSFTKGIDLGSIAVGVLLTIGFIYLNKQYKWIKL